MRNILIALLVLAVLGGGGSWWYLSQQNEVSYTTADKEEQSPSNEVPASPRETQGAAIGDENLVTFQCTGSKSITAVFERDIVGLTLSDGRQMTLRQSVSGSGIRYLSSDQKVEFQGKGSEASLIESGRTSYADCVASI